MSSKPPSFNDFVQIAYQYAVELQSEINQGIEWKLIKDKRLQNLVDDVVESLQKMPTKTFKPKNFDEHLYRQITRITDIKEKTEELENPSLKRIEDLCDIALRQLDNLQAADQSKRKITEEGLDACLNQDWAQDEFEELLKNNNAWAIDKTKELVKQNNPFAIQCLWLFASSNAELKEFLVQKMDEDLIQASLVLLIQKGAKDLIKKVTLVLADFLINHPKAWLWVIIENTFIDHSIFIGELFTRLLEKENCPAKVYSFIQDQLYEGHKDITEVSLHHIAQAALSSKLAFNPFLAHLFHQAKNSDKAKVTLIAMTFAITNAALKSHVCSRLYLEFEEDKLVDRLYVEAQQNDRRLLEIEEQSFLPACRWSIMPKPYRFGIIHLVLHRLIRFIHFCTGEKGSDIQTPKDYECSDHFPKFSKALMGISCDITSIVQQLSDYEIESYIAVSDGRFRDAQRSSRLEKKNATLGHTIQEAWMRDYFYQNKSSIRLLPFDSVLDDLDYLIHVDRETRLPKEAFRHIPDPLGSSANAHQNITIFEHLQILMGDKHVMSKKDAQMQMGFYEGGNTLQGNDYIILGKDSFAATKYSLLLKMASLGMRFGENGLVLDEPYEDDLKYPEGRLSSSEFQNAYNSCMKRNLRKLPDLTDDFFKEIVALDFGLSSKEHVFLVEQPHYHLDVAMTILDPKEKIVLLNDTQRAFEKLQSSIERNQEKNKYKKEEISLINERLKKFGKRVKPFKNLEDECEKDLLEQGFKVVRMGGAFDQLDYENPENHRVNFFNTITFTDKKDQRHLIALGTENSEYKEEFEKIMAKYLPDVKIHYADVKFSERLLAYDAGLHCLMQMIS